MATELIRAYRISYSTYRLWLCLRCAKTYPEGPDKEPVTVIPWLTACDRCHNKIPMTEQVRVRIVPEYPGLVVSSDGRIQGPSGKWLKTFPGKSGYLRFNIYLGNRKWSQHNVHTAVCVAFHGPRPEGQLVRHLDGNPKNNCAENLAWGTFLDNEADKARHGRNLEGVRHHQAKLTEEDVRAIRSSTRTGKDLARHYRVSESTLSAIRKRKIWKHI